MRSRKEILSYKDQELIDYYDECIVSFEDYQAKAEKVRNLRQDYWKHLNLHQLVSCGWVLALLFLILGTVGLWSESHPAMTTMTTEERETIDFFRDLLSIEAKQSYDRIGEDFTNTLHSGILVFCRGIILLSATAFVILLFIFLTKRKIYRSEFIEAKRNYTTYFNSLKYELDDPSNKIKATPHNSQSKN